MKALIITGKYATEREVYYPLYRMQEEGWEVDVAVHNGVIGVPVLGAVGDKIVPTVVMPITVFPDWSVLILPGGAKAMEYTRQDEVLLSTISAHYRRGGIIGVICHGTQLMISAGLVKGRLMSGYYSIKDDIINAGGTYPEGDPAFVRDGKIVSTSHYKHMGLWMHEVIKVANGL